MLKQKRNPGQEVQGLAKHSRIQSDDPSITRSLQSVGNGDCVALQHSLPNELCIMPQTNKVACSEKLFSRLVEARKLVFSTVAEQRDAPTGR